MCGQEQKVRHLEAPTSSSTSQLCKPPRLIRFSNAKRRMNSPMKVGKLFRVVFRVYYSYLHPLEWETKHIEDISRRRGRLKYPLLTLVLLWFSRFQICICMSVGFLRSFLLAMASVSVSQLWYVRNNARTRKYQTNNWNSNNTGKQIFYDDIKSESFLVVQ